MHGNPFLLYWQSQKDWYVYDEQRDLFLPAMNAPEKAIESFIYYWNYYERKGILKKRTIRIYKDFIAAYKASKVSK